MRKYRNVFLMTALTALYALGLRAAGMAVPTIEIAAIMLLVPSLMLTRMQKRLGLWMNAAACVLLGVYFYGVGLTGQVILRSVLFLAALWSLAKWGSERKSRRPSSLSVAARLALVVPLAAIVAWKSAGGLVAALDFATLYAILAGAALLPYKKRETWYMWLFADSMGMAMFSMVGAWMNVFFSAFGVANDAFGIRDWSAKK